jgi:hypothetical protein
LSLLPMPGRSLVLCAALASRCSCCMAVRRCLTTWACSAGRWMAGGRSGQNLVSRLAPGAREAFGEVAARVNGPDGTDADAVEQLRL